MPKKKLPVKQKKTTKTTKIITSKNISTQSVLNIGLVGHVDHGKTTLVSRLSGKWTDTHSEEIRRGITIRLGYADSIFYLCEKCKVFSPTEKCPDCSSNAEPQRKVSFIDAPGHESLMATMLSGAAIMDAAVLLVAANEKCPQPQTKEHLMALEIIGCKNVIIVQNKIDLITQEEAFDNYKQIKKFVKGTIAENAPIIPISAQHNTNIHILIQAIEENFKTPKRDISQSPILLVARSFDVNKPGTNINSLVGGVLGGALKCGVLKKGQEIEIKPGFSLSKDNKSNYKTIRTKVVELKTGSSVVEEVQPGGSLGLQTVLDPFYVKSDTLTGNIVGLPGKLPPVWEKFSIKPNLLERVVGSKEDLKVDPIKIRETLMLNVNAAATVGVVTDFKKGAINLILKIPVCCSKEDRITISRMIGNRWRLIGYGTIV